MAHHVSKFRLIVEPCEETPGHHDMTGDRPGIRHRAILYRKGDREFGPVRSPLDIHHDIFQVSVQALVLVCSPTPFGSPQGIGIHLISHLHFLALRDKHQFAPAGHRIYSATAHCQEKNKHQRYGNDSPHVLNLYPPIHSKTSIVDYFHKYLMVSAYLSRFSGGHPAGHKLPFLQSRAVNEIDCKTSFKILQWLRNHGGGKVHRVAGSRLSRKGQEYEAAEDPEGRMACFTPQRFLLLG